MHLPGWQVLTGVGVRGKTIAKVKTIKVYAFGLCKDCWVQFPVQLESQRSSCIAFFNMKPVHFWADAGKVLRVSTLQSLCFSQK